MERLTTDKPVEEMGMYELAHNCMINKDGEAWYRDFGREIRLRDLVRASLKEYENLEYYKRCDSDDYLDEQLVEWSQIPPEEDFYGLLSCFYVLAWSNADLREALKHYEDMEEQGKLVILPCKPGDTVYVITRCNYISEVLDGDMYEPDGSPGDATGYYCPYELSQKCPHDCEEFTRCEDYKYKRAVFEDTVAQIHIAEDDLFIVCENTGIYRNIGKDIFLTEQEAQEALKNLK